MTITPELLKNSQRSTQNRDNGAPRSGRREALSRFLWGLSGCALIVVAWQLIVVITKPPVVTLPSPLQVAQSMSDNYGILWPATSVTLREVLIGFGLAVVLGSIAAILLVSSTIADRLIYPVLVLLNAVPKVAIAPLFLIWFGFGAKTNALLALTIAIFPVVINTALGLNGVGQEYLRLGQVMGANRVRLFMRIRLPAALPSIFAGLKLAITFATIGAIVGEFIAGQEGLGYLAQLTAGNLDTPLTFATIVIMSGLGLVLFYALVALEALVVRGRTPTR